MTEQPARTRQQRKNDFLARLGEDVDAWFSTSGGAAEPYLMPLSFLWVGDSMLVSTVRTNPTALNFALSGRARVAVGHTRDVYLIDALVGEVTKESIDAETGDAFAAKCGFDPRETKSYHFYRVEPQAVQSWRELNELADRELMTDGKWLI